MDSQRLRSGKSWRSSISPSLWPTWKKCYYLLGHITNCRFNSSTMQGGMNRGRFNEILVQLSANLNEHELAFFIYDGAPAHSNAASRREFIRLMKLPPYSPFLILSNKQLVHCYFRGVKLTPPDGVI